MATPFLKPTIEFESVRVRNKNKIFNFFSMLPNKILIFSLICSPQNRARRGWCHTTTMTSSSTTTTTTVARLTTTMKRRWRHRTESWRVWRNSRNERNRMIRKATSCPMTSPTNSGPMTSPHHHTRHHHHRSESEKKIFLKSLTETLHFRPRREDLLPTPNPNLLCQY